MNWSPKDSHMFPQLKQHLGGHKFKDVCEVGNRCGMTPGNKASAKNVKFVLRWADCLNWGADCVRTWWMVVHLRHERGKNKKIKKKPKIYAL